MRSRGTIPGFLLLAFVAGSCEKDHFQHLAGLKSVYKTYHKGEIKECRLDGELVFSAALNQYDAAEAIFDQEGNKIADCNYAWGSVDPICDQLTDCEVIYRAEAHISGEPSVDKYDLD